MATPRRQSSNTRVAILWLFNPTVRAVRQVLYKLTAQRVMGNTKYRTTFGEAETPAEQLFAPPRRNRHGEGSPLSCVKPCPELSEILGHQFRPW